ncbi:hypothetical protein AKJ42_00080 [candidate division MSBL1 archaeon SCGC-AAA261C02]|uniref:Phosphopantetheine adenylyltransferase n=3 Tax=candidate division MSBL1 TaxID=215777 RepID=A0A133V2F0_9EURY|nr:hypothetical protein AKJ42_00080 [candidate division MSBL1 archaeon SCGC-AAA261C02]
MKHEKVVVGGTFDYLHDGHKAILRKAFELGNQVLIGIVSDQMELKKDSVGIPPLEERKSKLEEFLEEQDWLERAEIVVISDPIGPAAEDRELEAIIVSEETRSRAEEINEIRESNDLEALDIIEIPWVLAEDGKPISSIRIRYGEMDEHGEIKKTEEDISDAG